MARVLAVSSQVVRGHVGLSAAVPALQRLGHEVWPVPTIVLSNHPGHPHAAGTEIEPGVLDAMLDALDRNGWLGEVDAVLTGYLPARLSPAEIEATVTQAIAEAGAKSAQDMGKVMSALIDDGVNGLIVCGSVGENTALRPEEKREMLKLAKDVAKGRVPVVSGVAEYTTELAREYARDAQKIGIDGLMAMPAMVYSAKPNEIVAHFRAVGAASESSAAIARSARIS